MPLEQFAHKSDSERPAVVIIAGPTASGKSRLALTLAQDLAKATQSPPLASPQAAQQGTQQRGAVIINSDASQVYRDIPIISAQPDASDRAAIEHRLYGYIDGAEICNAARWASDATHTIADVLAVGKIPILVGGSGLYLRSLLEGIAPVPDIPDTIRDAVRGLSTAEAAAALAREDPATAARLHVNDGSRIARALEVVRATGTSLAAWQGQHSSGIAPYIRSIATILLPPRDWLAERCEQRLETMLDNGAREEVARLRDRNLADSLPVMKAIGVAQISQWLDGTCDRTAALAATALATRQYAKRQYSWFRNQSPTDWNIVSESLSDETIETTVAAIRAAI